MQEERVKENEFLILLDDLFYWYAVDQTERTRQRTIRRRVD